MERNVLKASVLSSAKALGLLGITHRFLGQRLLILGYHGFELIDEAAFRPAMFMRRDVFAGRLEILRRAGCNVLPLGEGVERLKAGTLPPKAVCITIDDGFYSTLKVAAPVLQHYAMPATLYLTSYYSDKQAPVFRLIMQYMFWKTNLTVVDFDEYVWGCTTSLDDVATRKRLCWAAIAHGEASCDETGRQELARMVAGRLGVDYDEVAQARLVTLLDAQQLSQLPKFGVDVQLHTHRHNLPLGDDAALRREIRQNREYLHAVLGTDPQHFCYPSGVWDSSQWELLEAEGVTSATTCDVGFNRPDTPAMALYRMLDDNDMPPLVFESGITGFLGILRALVRKNGSASRREAPLLQ